MVTDFDVTVFLLDPIIFILWSFTFISLFLWGRGLFCGWLCPFGVLQEMAASIANKFSLKQLKISPSLHQQLQKLKYVILLVLVGVSFYSLEMAEVMSEVEPFKTAITLNFVRSWPFVVYAILLLGVGLFINKFYCRYVCPLGAGLAVLGKFHVFEWLSRRKECGQPCQTCHHACGINAIEKQGKIDYNECIQCLECIVIINDVTRCTPEIVKAKKKKRTEKTAVKIIQPSAA
jgi:NosR/NirI family nitrous oxide reductase transcriptional regulator